jgi:hypothetical protein
MKKTIIFTAILSIFLLNIASVTASPLRGQSLYGSTGLYSIPSGRIGWESDSNFGLDIGYRAIINNDEGVAHIPAITASLFNWVELSAAMDFQPSIFYDESNQRNDDLLLGIKIRLTNSGNTAIALGGNIQFLNFINENSFNYNAYQPYMAVTYSGSFFSMTAETTLVFGKTFYSGGPSNNSDVDFGMGFDLVLFPDVFGDAVHWIIDFANFGYSDNGWTNQLLPHTGPAHYRGVVNMGFRIDLSTIPIFNNNKFIIDFAFNDLFDDRSRAFTIGTVFGFSG